MKRRRNFCQWRADSGACVSAGWIYLKHRISPHLIRMVTSTVLSAVPTCLTGHKKATPSDWCHGAIIPFWTAQGLWNRSAQVAAVDIVGYCIQTYNFQKFRCFGFGDDILLFHCLHFLFNRLKIHLQIKNLTRQDNIHSAPTIRFCVAYV